MPVDVGDHLQLGFARRERPGLRDPRRAERALDHERVAVDPHRRHLGEVGAVAAVGVVDVPRVPLVRGVAEQLQEAEALTGGDEVAAGRGVDQRRDGAVRVDARPDEPVVEDPAVAVRDGRAGGGGGVHDRGRQRADAVRVHGRRVERDAPVARSRERGLRPGDELAQAALHSGVLALRLLVHPRDRRARQDVVELHQQHRAPQGVELVVRVHAEVADRGGREPQLRLPQQVLAAPVALLRARLRGVRAAVELEVHLARPHVRIPDLGLRGVEERERRAEGHARRPLEVARAVRRRRHLAGRPAAAVAPSERDDGRVAHGLLGVLPLGAREVLPGEVGVVGVHRREVREDPAPVDALPEERVVRHRVGLVPRLLLREEVLGACAPHDLRQRSRVAERVGQPHLAGVDPELVEEEPLALHELADERLAARHVRVRLDPHAADWHEPALGDALAEALEELRVVLLQPRVLLRAGGGEHEVGILVHEREHVREGPGDLAARLAHGPEPGGVDVRVADRGDPVRARVGGRGEHGRELPPAGGGGAGDVVGIHRVAHALERREDLRAPR